MSYTIDKITLAAGEKSNTEKFFDIIQTFKVFPTPYIKDKPILIVSEEDYAKLMQAGVLDPNKRGDEV